MWAALAVAFVAAPSYAEPINALAGRSIELQPALDWFQRPDASGRVTVLNFDDLEPDAVPATTLAFLAISVQKLRCRGPAFSIDEADKEPYRTYELQVNGFPMLSFNPECSYAAGVGGSYTTRLLVEASMLPFDIDGLMTFEIVLQPDNVVALVGQDDF